MKLGKVKKEEKKRPSGSDKVASAGAQLASPAIYVALAGVVAGIAVALTTLLLQLLVVAPGVADVNKEAKEARLQSVAARDSFGRCRGPKIAIPR